MISVPALALASALCSAAATIFISRGLRNYGPYTGVWVNLIVGTACVWLAVILGGGVGRPTVAGVAYFALAGLIGTFGGRVLRFISIDAVGASMSAALINLSPLIASVLAILILGERVTVPIVIGTLVIVVGTTLLSAGGRSTGIRPVALLLPLTSALCFGVVAILRKIGLMGMTPVFGFAVNVTAALVAYTAFLLASRQRAMMLCRGRSLVYFVMAGVAENVGVFLLLEGLSLGTVSVVAPLASVSPIFVLALSFFFLRGIDILNRRIVAGTLLIVSGVYLITALR
jgi:drug/metabolite transporter (DMT)-like permease